MKLKHSKNHSLTSRMKLKLKHSKFLRKPQKVKVYRPNNRSAELAANKETPFYKKMTTLKGAKGFVGKKAFGLSFHLGRHSKEECGAKWDEGCVDAVACYTAQEDGGCCYEWTGEMDTTAACAPCAEALGYCDACFPKSWCALSEWDTTSADDGDDGWEDAEGHDGEWEHGEGHDGEWDSDSGTVPCP